MDEPKKSQKPQIIPLPNGPYYYFTTFEPKRINGITNSKGEELFNVSGVAFCRCGGSENKPFCDGTHGKLHFNDRKETDGHLDKRVNYVGEKITIHDNRGICSHVGFCTDSLPSVFKLGEEPWIDPNGAEVEEIIHPTGFFRQKTKSVIGAGRTIVEEFGGEVPGRMEDLLRLPGVARKTANVVLGTWFSVNAGIVVDTHVGRIAARLKLAWSNQNSKDARRIEQDLMRVVPPEDWAFFAHALIWHGRRVCTARRPGCDACPLARQCPSAGRTDA